MKSRDDYVIVKVIEYPNAVIRVYRAEIPEEERRRRIRKAESAAAELLEHCYYENRAF